MTSSFGSASVPASSRPLRLVSAILGASLAWLLPLGVARADAPDDDGGCSCDSDEDPYGEGGYGGSSEGEGGAGGVGGAGGSGGGTGGETSTVGAGVTALERIDVSGKARSRTAHAACPQKPLQHDRGAWPAMLTFGAAASVVALRQVRRRPK